MKKKKLHIVVFYQYFGTPKGGWSTRVYEFCRRWVAQGHTVTVVTAPYEKSDIKADGFISHQEIEGIRLIVINSGDSNRVSIPKRVVRAIVFSFVSIWYALRLKADVLIASSGPITIGVPLMVRSFIKRTPCIFEVRDLWPAGGIEMGLITKKWQQRWALWFEKMCYSYSTGIVTASPGQKEHILKRYPTLSIEVIPNASDIGLFSSPVVTSLPSWTHRRTLFTHIGSLGFIHNTPYWMEVARELKKRMITPPLFIFIGDGSERPILENLREQWELDFVHFLGLMPKTELPLWVQSSAATLFSTLDNPVQNASSPNKIFDSFAAGVPVIQTTTGWINQLVSEHECGVTVPVQSPEEAAQRIVEFLANTDRQTKMRRNASHVAKTMFNRDLLSEKYLEFIQKVGAKDI